MGFWNVARENNEIIRRDNVQIKVVQVGLFSTNCYLVMNDDTLEGFIIDPGSETIKINSEIEEMGMVPVAILITHGHFDHIMAVDELKMKYKIQSYVHEAEAEVLKDSYLNSSARLGRKRFTTVPDVLLKDEEVISPAGIDVKTISTPGHTQGGACFYLEKEKLLFSGDTLFCESIGRTDLPTGDTDLLIRSVKTRLAVLPEDVFVLPGHGEPTSIGHEKQCNSYMRSNLVNE